MFPPLWEACDSKPEETQARTQGHSCHDELVYELLHRDHIRRSAPRNCITATAPHTPPQTTQDRYSGTRHCHRGSKWCALGMSTRVQKTSFLSRLCSQRLRIKNIFKQIRNQIREHAFAEVPRNLEKSSARCCAGRCPSPSKEVRRLLMLAALFAAQLTFAGRIQLSNSQQSGERPKIDFESSTAWAISSQMNVDTWIICTEKKSWYEEQLIIVSFSFLVGYDPSFLRSWLRS